MAEFGSFHDFCTETTSGICRIFRSQPQPTCVLNAIHFSNQDYQVSDLGSFIVSCIALGTVIYLCYRAQSKHLSVGRLELSFLYFVCCCVLLCQIVGVDCNFPVVSQWFACVYVALVVTTFWCLLYNGIVGYQFLPDGSWQSLSAMLISSILVFSTAFYITIDTHLGITTTLEPKDGPLGLTSPALFTLYYIFPLACLLGYLGLQTILVLYFLSARKPFWYLYSAALSFTVGQIFLLVLSDPLCRASENVVDGSLFSTLFTTASLVLLCFYWSAITLDENDEYETVAVA